MLLPEHRHLPKDNGRVPLRVKARAEVGRRVAAVLGGSWRPAPPPPGFSDEDLPVVSPLLLGMGAAGLGWWRVRDSVLRESPAALKLRQAYRLQVLQAAIHERRIERILPVLRSAGIQPLLGKGWAIARLYPDPGLRPYGDIDLYVPSEQFLEAAAALAAAHMEERPEDLHRGFAELDDRDTREIHARSQLVKLGGLEVRVFGPEDHLRLLALHMLRHGLIRPLWLCDVAVALESLPGAFDWAYFFRGSPRRSEWVAGGLELSRRLLDARIDAVPKSRRATRLPLWLVPSVLRQWAKATTPQGARTPMAAFLRRPEGLLEALRLRWPNAIEATIHVGGPFNDLPRVPFQLGTCVARTARFVWQAARQNS